MLVGCAVRSSASLTALGSGFGSAGGAVAPASPASPLASSAPASTGSAPAPTCGSGTPIVERPPPPQATRLASSKRSAGTARCMARDVPLRPETAFPASSFPCGRGRCPLGREVNSRPSPPVLGPRPQNGILKDPRTMGFRQRGTIPRVRGLYPIVDADALNARGIALLDFAEQILLARPPLLQLRAKHWA